MLAFFFFYSLCLFTKIPCNWKQFENSIQTISCFLIPIFWARFLIKFFCDTLNLSIRLLIYNKAARPGLEKSWRSLQQRYSENSCFYSDHLDVFPIHMINPALFYIRKFTLKWQVQRVPKNFQTKYLLKLLWRLTFTYRNIEIRERSNGII